MRGGARRANRTRARRGWDAEGARRTAGGGRTTRWKGWRDRALRTAVEQASGALVQVSRPPLARSRGRGPPAEGCA